MFTKTSTSQRLLSPMNKPTQNVIKNTSKSPLKKSKLMTNPSKKLKKDTPIKKVYKSPVLINPFDK